jgi:hypothetical protein
MYSAEIKKNVIPIFEKSERTPAEVGHGFKH